MVAEARLMCHPNLSLQLICPAPPPLPPPPQSEAELLDVLPAESELSRSGSALTCSTSIQLQTTPPFESTTRKFLPTVRSGSYTDIGPRRSNEDQHIRIDNLFSQLQSPYSWSESTSFYAVFDGHGGPDAAAYMKENAIRIFFEDVELSSVSEGGEKFLQDLETSHCRAFLSADQTLSDESCKVDSYCGTTALTALVLGRNLLIANAGDSRAVLCRKGVAVQLSQDHRPSCQVERKRVEDLGGTIEDGYLNGELALTRALGDWYMKAPFGSSCPLIAQPESQWTQLGEDDEFLIIGCDGIWDVVSNQEAVSLVRRKLRHHNDPQRCARELVEHALRGDACDNVTAIVVCFSSSPENQDSVPPQRPRFRFAVSEEGRNRLRSLLEGN